MIFEILASTVPMVIYTAFTIKTTMQADKELKVSESLSDAVQLVIELMRSDDTWHYGSSDEFLYNNKYGIQIYCMSAGITLRIRNEDDKLKSLILNKAETNAVRKEYQAFKARKSNREQAEIARILANRVLGKNGTPFLGGPESPSYSAEYADQNDYEDNCSDPEYLQWKASQRLLPGESYTFTNSGQNISDLVYYVRK